MKEKDFLLYARLFLVISLPTAHCSGWTPIAPPEDYYANKPKYPFPDNADEVQAAETQVKSSILSHPKPLFQEKSFLQNKKKLNLEIYKPTEISFFPSANGKNLDSSFATYQEVLQQSPSSFFSFKTYEGPGKPSKTIYYGDLELAKPKFTNDIKYYKPYKQNLKNDVKIYKPARFLDNDINFYQQSNGNLFKEHCSLYKVSFRQDLYYQYIQYKVHMPELSEFTLCLWMRFHNHSHKHSLFSYSAKHHRQAIYMWVSNLNEPGIFNMKILGQRIFTLNYPIKLFKWYHTCQSWNGNTGEWQVWVDSHRIARGYHNLLVNHPIPGGGVAISGQENRHFGKGFQEVPPYLKGTGGLEGEITMLQMYKIALTAGKAYNDHSHHHSHYTSTTAEPPELPTEEPSTTTDHPLLENGQLKKHVNVLELAEAIKNGQLDTPDPHPSFHHYFDKPLAQPFVSHLTLNLVGLPSHAIFKRNDESKEKEHSTDLQVDLPENINNNPERIKVISNVSDKVQVEKIKFSNKNDKVEVADQETMIALPYKSVAVTSNKTNNDSREDTTADHSNEDQSEEGSQSSGQRIGRRLRRHSSQSSTFKITGNRTNVMTTGESRPPRYVTYGLKKRSKISKNIPRKTTGNEGKEASKRQILFEEPYLSFGSVGLTGQDLYPAYGGIPSTGFSFNHFSQFGQDFPDLNSGGEENIDDSLSNDDSGKKIKKEVELAEGEVRRIMELCSGCHLDPFRKVVVISWRSTPKKIYSGALFIKARSECKNF